MYWPERTELPCARCARGGEIRSDATVVTLSRALATTHVMYGVIYNRRRRCKLFSRATKLLGIACGCFSLVGQAPCLRQPRAFAGTAFRRFPRADCPQFRVRLVCMWPRRCALTSTTPHLGHIAVMQASRAASYTWCSSQTRLAMSCSPAGQQAGEGGSQSGAPALKPSRGSRSSATTAAAAQKRHLMRPTVLSAASTAAAEASPSTLGRLRHEHGQVHSCRKSHAHWMFRLRSGWALAAADVSSAAAGPIACTHSSPVVGVAPFTVPSLVCNVRHQQCSRRPRGGGRAQLHLP